MSDKSDSNGSAPAPMTPVQYTEYLQKRAQTLLESVAPDGVSPEVSRTFLEQLESIVDERRDIEMWHQVGLGGAHWVASYPDAEKAAEAVQALATDGHGHHFAVLNDGLSLSVSKMGVTCLRNYHIKERERAERLERRRGPDLGDDPDGDVEGADWGTP